MIADAVGRSRTASSISPRCSSSVSVEASPVVPQTTKPSEPLAARWCISDDERVLVDAQLLVERRDDGGDDGAEVGHLAQYLRRRSGRSRARRTSLSPRTAGARGRRAASAAASPTRRTASSTPGMKDSRRDRVVADRQRLAEVAEDHLLVGDEPGQADRVDRRRRASARRGHQRRRARRRAARRVELAVVVQLDDLGGRHVRAASAAKRIISTAPIAKLGATNTFAPPTRPRARRRRSRSCRSRRARPPRRQASALPSAVSGCVKSTTTSQSARIAPSATPSAGSARPRQLQSGAPATARHSRLPHSPGGARRRRRGSCASASCRRCQRRDRGAEERPRPGRSRRRRAARGRTARPRARASCSASTASISRDRLVDLEDRHSGENRRAEPLHARRRSTPSRARCGP